MIDRKLERVVVWFSCGAASAVAGMLALAEFGGRLPVVFAYCDTGSEHEDNARFLRDLEAFYGQPIARLKSKKYADIWEVFERERYLVGPRGAKCTGVLKKAVRYDFERVASDLQIFGFDASEGRRAERFADQNPEVLMRAPLVEAGFTKADCFESLRLAGIELPAMYRLGYRNNNCIGCVKGNAGYWNKIRLDFPDVFARMAELEARLGARICQATINGVRVRVRLVDLPPEAGRYEPIEEMSCGLLCDSAL